MSSSKYFELDLLEVLSNNSVGTGFESSQCGEKEDVFNTIDQIDVKQIIDDLEKMGWKFSKK